MYRLRALRRTEANRFRLVLVAERFEQDKIPMLGGMPQVVAFGGRVNAASGLRVSALDQIIQIGRDQNREVDLLDQLVGLRQFRTDTKTLAEIGLQSLLAIFESGGYPVGGRARHAVRQLSQGRLALGRPFQQFPQESAPFWQPRLGA